MILYDKSYFSSCLQLPVADEVLWQFFSVTSSPRGLRTLPIIGVLILIGICAAILNFVATFGAGMLADFGIIAAAAVYLVLASLGAGLTGISIALIYARLREIKDGVSVDQIVSVFD